MLDSVSSCLIAFARPLQNDEMCNLKQILQQTGECKELKVVSARHTLFCNHALSAWVLNQVLTERNESSQFRGA